MINVWKDGFLGLLVGAGVGGCEFFGAELGIVLVCDFRYARRCFCVLNAAVRGDVSY